MRKEERWERRGNLGSGTFGTVWLEKLITDNSEEKYRAVKEIKKDIRQSGAIDYSRELEAIAKFSHQKVRRSSISAHSLLVYLSSLLQTIRSSPQRKM
jgi:serine/threonine protein kinase